MGEKVRRYVLIGSGVAAIAAAEAIRSQDARGEITLVSDDPHGYYSRPGLAYFLTGEVDQDFLFPFSERDFRRLDLRRLLARVDAIEPRAHQLRLNHGDTLPYDRLLVATGAQAVRPDLPGIHLNGTVKLDNLEDARRMLKLARPAKNALVVGGGITALEIVEGLVAQKVRTHYFMRGDRYWSNVLDESEAHIVEHRLMEAGVQIHRRTEAAELLGRGSQVVAVRTKDNRQFPVDLVAYAIGVRPRLELAHNSGLKTERGILVDETMQTDQADIYAAGDAAQVFDPLSGKAVLDTLWGPAREQGRIAGLNMAGVRTSYTRQAVFNVTRLAGQTTTIIGTVGAGSDLDLVGIARGDSETWRLLPEAITVEDRFEVNRLRLLIGERTLMGAVVMGDQTLSRPLQHLVAWQVDIRPIRTSLLEGRIPLGDLITGFWIQWSRENVQKRA